MADGATVERGCPGLSGALAVARDRCEVAAKDGYNDYHKYRYASADEVIRVASQAMRETGLALVPVSEELTTLGVSQQSIYALNRQLLLTHSSGESLALTVRGWPVIPERGRPLDKALAVALTTSLAYKLRDLLQMPRGDDEDDLAAQDDRQTPATPSPVARTSQAPPRPEPEEVPLERVAYEIQVWTDWLAGNPDLDAFNETLRNDMPNALPAARKQMWILAKGYAAENGWEFDADVKRFHVPEEEGE